MFVQPYYDATNVELYLKLKKKVGTLAELAARASFLGERLQSKEIIIKEDKNLAQKRYKLWQERLASQGSKEIFKRRLFSEGISFERAKKVLGRPVWNDRYPLPE